MKKTGINIENEGDTFPIGFGGYTEPRRRSKARTILATVGGVLFVLAAVSGVAFYFYWQSLKSTPQYSLALIVDAAKRNDEKQLNELIDIDAVVEDFLPQITGKAVELYGRGFGKDLLERIAHIAAPVMPAVKDRAREELPGAIRQKTSEFGNVPFVAMVLAADTYLDIKLDGEKATVRSRLPEHVFEVQMKRSGERWKIVAVKDEKLATTIAQRVGQEIIDIATNGIESRRSRLGIKNINELINEAEKIFR
ncbi:MAG: hypothetical protein KIT61_17190 [Pyrinomonadaceae bacterium]|nr:hypothetical protein [Blastocatellia bacterium]MCW5958320.1 hypothetical protein [Pyrinomonadaceae bacterium]